MKHKDRLKMQYIIRAMEPARVKWDMFIICLAVYNSIGLPIDLAFQPPMFQWGWVIVGEILIDTCFILDIILAFRTTYMNPLTGEEVFCSRTIALNYLKGTFWIDFFATVPFERIAKIVISE